MFKKTLLIVAAMLIMGSTTAAEAGVHLGFTPPKTVGVMQPPSSPSGPHRQPVDPNPNTGGDYSGDSAGGSGGGGYMGDPDHPGHQQF
ncbi:MAG: hypothetical protein WA441_01715 [Methyloceanibacter sp.]|jgi:hypothetical protein